MNLKKSHLSSRKLICLALFFTCFNLCQSAIYNAPCETDEHCIELYTPAYKCYANHCQRKHFTYSTKELMGILTVIVISMIANAGGLGAGAVIIPIYMYFFNFVATDAIPLSKITIWAGAIVNVYFYWKKRHVHDKNRFLINYEVASIMIPLLLAGTTVGVMLSRFLPSVIISGALVFYITLSLLKLYKRANALHLEEVAKKLKENAGDLGYELKETSGDNSNPPIERFTLEGDREVLEERTLTTRELVGLQAKNFTLMIMSYVFIMFGALARGGEGSASIFGIKECSFMSWFTLVLTQVGSVGLAYTGYKFNNERLKKYDQVVVAKFDDEAEKKAELDVIRGKRNTLLGASYITGVAAGTLGIGGGMILGPAMLAMKMNPELSTALSAFTVLFTSSSTTLQFSIAGAIHMEHAWLFMTLSLIGSVIGNLGLRALIDYYQKPSLLVWIIFGILLLAGLVLPAQVFTAALDGQQGLFVFAELC